jgi:hypothetical protein
MRLIRKECEKQAEIVIAMESLQDVAALLTRSGMPVPSRRGRSYHLVER